MRNKENYNRFFDNTALSKLRSSTPFFVFSRNALLHNFNQYRKCFPARTEICFALKANSEKTVLKTLNEAGSSFEAASKYELSLLKDLQVSPGRIIYGTSVKAANHIAEFASYGTDRFAFDSEDELLKIAAYAPGARVYVRALVDSVSSSVFNLSEKFGTPLKHCVALLQKAQAFGLVPYGISFCVGSQARNEKSWSQAIKEIAPAMTELSESDIHLRMINLGGGFPHDYEKNEGFPAIEQITGHIRDAVSKLPYEVEYLIEPGRGLVANSFVLITTIIAKASRAGKPWLYLDAGVYNALMESLTCQGSTKYLIESLAENHSASIENFIVAGPTGDDLDVISRNTVLPSVVKAGDKLIIWDTGAYTTVLATGFNGFPKPKMVTI
jgi:ornithine decarboxylase